MRKLGIERNQVMSTYVETQDALRIAKARRSSSTAKRVERKESWLQKRKELSRQESAEGATYVSGGF